MTATVFTSVYAARGEIERYDGFAIVRMHGCTFMTTPMELARALDWARTCPSTGNPSRDRSMFVQRIPHVLAPAGSSLASRGDRRVLTQLVRSMRGCGVPTEGWRVPEDVGAGLAEEPVSETTIRSGGVRRAAAPPPSPASPPSPAARR